MNQEGAEGLPVGFTAQTARGSPENRLVHLRKGRENEGGLLPLGQRQGFLVGSLTRQDQDGNINSQTKSD